MKKSYIKPTAEQFDIESQMLMAGSIQAKGDTILENGGNAGDNGVTEGSAKGNDWGYDGWD
jgi:hypothetical protein